MSDNVPHFDRFVNDCWFVVLHKVNHLFCGGEHNIMELFHESNYVSFAEFLKLGEQMPVELLDNILDRMSIRIRIVHTNSIRFIGSSLSNDEIKDYYVLHVGNLNQGRGHYTLEEANSHESFEVYYTESEVERSDREAEREAEREAVREAVRLVDALNARAAREAVRQVEELAERGADREAEEKAYQDVLEQSRILAEREAAERSLRRAREAEEKAYQDVLEQSRISAEREAAERKSLHELYMRYH